MLESLRKHLPLLPPLPYPHFMGFCALDCWGRMLLARGAGGRGIARISARYWPRLIGALATSTLGTAITLPERVLVWPLVAMGAAGRSRTRATPIVFILGYYRSGTTHLHYLLSCDPQFVTPRWYQALAPQGFALSWTFLRYFLVPFLSSRRPQDDVAYGPEYPAEDDFAVCNTNAACTMPGRMVLPGEWENFSRYQTLEGLSEQERRRFAGALQRFVWKLETLNPRRGVLLKTPAHTARAGWLHAMFGERARFVHLSREPGPVLKSNIAMHRRYEPFLLQPHPGDAEIRRRVIEEYNATERAWLRDRATLAPGSVASMRYTDLIADPMHEVRRVYAALNLTLSAEAETRMRAYLASVRDYRTASQREKKAAEAAPPSAKERSLSSPESAPELDWMVSEFGHDRPAAQPSTREIGEASVRHRSDSAYVLSVVAAAWCAALWLLAAYVGHSRLDWLVWPTGLVIGLTTLRSAGRGTTRLGAWAAMLTLVVLLLIAFPATWIADYRDRDPVPWDHVWLSTRRGVLAMNNIFWVGLGVLTAFRYASREHVRPPGL